MKPRAVRTALVALLAGASLLAAPGLGYPAGTVVGGTPIVVQSAPWAVYLRVSMGATGSFCSGSIIDAQHVVTAAHCVYGPDGTPVPATALRIRAGISSSSRTIRSDAEQDRDVVSVRVHPGYGGPAAGSADDVAVLTLDQPLDFGGTAVQPVALPGPGTGFPAANADVGFAGFGRENPAVPATGSLNWLTARVDEQATCGDFTSSLIRDDDAVTFCAAAPSNAVCSGDSGSGLVTTGPSRVLIGVVSAGEAGCLAGTRTIFTAVWAQEILQFVQGNDAPPIAPRRTPATYARLFWDPPLVPGKSLLCYSDRWDGNPTFTYAFLSSSGRVLQEGPNRFYRVSARSAGDILSCRVSATNAGGTAILATDWVGAVAPSPLATAVASRVAKTRTKAAQR